MISWSGKALDGEANTQSIFRILIYASIPAVLVLILYIIQIFCWGLDVFKVNHDYTVGIIPQEIMFWLILAIELILSLFTLVFTVIGISEVQQFGIGKAILNLLLPIALVMIPVLLIYVISS